MRKRNACLAAALANAVAAAPAAAQIEQDPATGLITCTTPPGRLSRRIVSGLGEGGRITGQIRLVTPNPSERWTAAGGFLFREARRPTPGVPIRNAGVQVALRPGTTNRIVVGIHLPGGRPLTEIGEYPANQWIPLSVSLANGSLTIQFGRQTIRRRVQLTEPLQPVIHCNSGTFEFRLGPGLGLGDYP